MSQDMSAVLYPSGASVSAPPFSSNDMVGLNSNTPRHPSQPLQHQQQQPPPPLHSKRQRYSSRSNSVSGSSMTTVQHVTSRSSSRNGSSYPMRSQSPGDTSLHALRLVGNGHSRRRSVAVDPSDRSSNNNLEIVNRWSQSTDSSLASSGKHQRASSGVLLTSQSLSPARKPPPPIAVDHLLRAHPQSKQASQGLKTRQRPVSPVETPVRPWTSTSRPSSRDKQTTNLPALQTGVTRRERSESPSTASTGVLVTSASATPSTHSSYAPEYFTSHDTSPPNNVKTQRSQTARTVTTPSVSLNYSRMPRAEDVKESAHFRRKSEHLVNMERDAKASKTPVEEKRSNTRPRDRTEKEKKAMLSKALEKANTAVVLDNQQIFVGALVAYMDACMLLQQVMDRSVNAADKRKLDAIKITYTTRIEELRLLEETRAIAPGEKTLPDRPQSDDALSPIDGHMHDPAFIGTAVETRLKDVPQLSYSTSDRDSFFSRTMADVDKASRQNEISSAFSSHVMESGETKSGQQHGDGRVHIINQRVSKLPAPEDTHYLPAPLGIKKSPSPTVAEFKQEPWQPSDSLSETFYTPVENTRTQEEAHDAAWLDTIKEGRSSRSSSVHSGSLQTGLRRKPIQGNDDTSTAELDAAFDAAVEAVYDEGLEPDFEHKGDLSNTSQLRVMSVALPSSDIKEIMSPTAAAFGKIKTSALTRTIEDDEEERMLDEFTQNYGHGFNFAFGTKSALPRQSDSSGYSRSTWQSSQASERLTAGTSLTTVAENESTHRSLPTTKPPLPPSPVNLDTLPPPAPPPLSTTLPPLPTLNRPGGSTVRHRRLSGQNARELKIETSGEAQGRQHASTIHNGPPDFDEITEHDTDTHKEVMTVGAPLEASPSDAAHEHMLKSPPSLDILSTFASSDRATMPYTPLATPRSDDTFGNMLQVRPTLVRKNLSSLSLRADHTILLPSPGLHELGDPTPLSATFTIAKPKIGQDPLTSQRVAFSNFASPLTHAGGNLLFDTSLTSGRYHTSPLQSPSDVPAGLEPCPESFLMRPFWLMRCLASTMTHSRGGYITTKLFVPREVWQTRGVKLKSVDDKIANCDLLTAALGQLSQVDTFDADAVMDELQRFEELMERVQGALIKKLGNEVGVHGVSALFRDAAPSSSSTSSVVGSDKGSDTLSGTTDKSSRSHSSKGYLSSWRKLRSKSSGAPTSHATTMHTGVRSGEKELHAMASVPMTSFVPVERRGQKRDLRNLSFEGPNKEYMGSLARLFQSVQVLDQIARQVEDPGLKHSSPTHVGLELSIRHAAEFFSFYICRFVLADLGVMMDKFIKRGTEWVMI